MTSACLKYCLEAIQLSEALLKLARDAHSDCDDDHCLVLFGIILDAATNIRLEAEKRLDKLQTVTSKGV